METTFKTLGLLGLLGACSSESAKPRESVDPIVVTKDAAGGSAVEANATPDLGEIMAWMPKGAGEAWQGAWFTKLALRDGKGWSSLTGTYVAMELTGDKVKVWDSSTQRDHQLGAKLDKPCSMTFTKQIDGATHYYHKQYVIDGGAVLAGGGGAGYRNGKTAIVCMNDSDIYTLDAKGHCKLWTERFDKWEVKDTTCKWTAADGKDVLVVGEGGMSNELTAKGNLLANIHFRDALEGKDHRREQDFETAKAAAMQRFKETDPLERARTAGGKVGETSTIISLQATFIADKTAIKGKPIEIRGRFVEVKKGEEKGKAEYRVKLVDAADLKEKDWELVCRSATEVKGFKEGDKVKVKGTVDEWWDRAAVIDCVVSR